MAERGNVDNRFSGTNTGNLVQVGAVSGGLHVHVAPPGPDGGGDRRRLLAVLRRMTFPVSVGDEPRTAFAVAPGQWVTYGADGLVFLAVSRCEYPYVSGVVEPADELWALGFHSEAEHPDVIGLRCNGVLDAYSKPHRLELLGDQPGAGSTGGPVVNLRTGAVCGLMVVTDDGIWLMPSAMITGSASPANTANRSWLELLDDNQLLAGGHPYPGARLRAYLSDVCQLGDGHPYRPMVRQGPSLTEFYLPQHLHDDTDRTRRISAKALAERHESVQILGDPGVGKSSLVRYVAADSAKQWLSDGRGAFVPIPVAARALIGGRTLPAMLADGITGEIATVLDRTMLVEMFGREPMPGVPWLVLVDGLDEVMNDFDRQSILRMVLHQSGRSVHRFVVTTRPLGSGAFTTASAHSRFPTYVVEPFTDEELVQFALAWFRDANILDPEATVGAFVAAIARSGLDQLARVPLMAMMLCILFTSEHGIDLPRSQFDVYDRFFGVLARKLEGSTTREQLRERVAALGEEAVRAVGMLVTDLHSLLEAVAAARQGLLAGAHPDSTPVLALAVTRSLPRKPAVIPDDTWADLVTEMLRASGLLVHHRNGFRFLHQTIEEYLAARHLATSPDRETRRTVLRPHLTWPWPHLEVKVFVVALWVARGIDLTPDLTKLLSRRNRDRNAAFIIELARRGVDLPDRIRSRTRRWLIDRIHSRHVQFREWQETVRWLHTFDPESAAAELERYAHLATTSDRAIDAIHELAALDRNRAAAAAAWLAGLQSTSPETRIKAAGQLSRLDPQRGLDLLTTLTRDPTMGTLAVEAATRAADSSPQGIDLLLRLSTTSDDIAIRLAAAHSLSKRDPNRAATVLDALVWDPATSPDRKLDLVTELCSINPDAANTHLTRIIEAPVEPPLRLRAAQLLSQLDPGQGMRAVTRLTHTAGVDHKTQLEAAAYLAAHLGQGTHALRQIALRHPSLPPYIRILAAVRIGDTDQAMAVTTLLGVAQKFRLSASQHRETLDAAVRLDPDRAGPAMISYLRAGGTPTRDKLASAATLIGVGLGTDALSTLESVANDHKTQQDRLTAAQLLERIDSDRATAAYIGIAEDLEADDPIRIAATEQIRTRNRPLALSLFLEICASGNSWNGRIDAGRKAGEIDPRAGINALQDILLHESASHQIDHIGSAILEIDHPMALAALRGLKEAGMTRAAIRDALRRTPGRNAR